MRKLVWLLILVPLLIAASFAANTATDNYTANECYMSNCGIHYVTASFDTTGSDLTLYTPSKTTNTACIVGILFSETSATNITFKSGSTSIVVPELAANQGVWGGAPICAKKGEALAAQVSVAVSSMLFKIMDVDILRSW